MEIALFASIYFIDWRAERYLCGYWSLLKYTFMYIYCDSLNYWFEHKKSVKHQQKDNTTSQSSHQIFLGVLAKIKEFFLLLWIAELFDSHQKWLFTFLLVFFLLDLVLNSNDMILHFTALSYDDFGSRQKQRSCGSSRQTQQPFLMGLK